MAQTRSDLVVRARDRRLRPADVAEGTFTISNLGMFGVDAFHAIVNAPQAAILAIGRILDRVVPVDGQAAVRPMMTVSLSFDHRVVDGLDAYLAKATDERTRGVQAGVIGWYGVPRAASSLLRDLRCSAPDLSFFCDRRVDAGIARAVEVEATDADAAVAQWARIERDIVDRAPWVPLFTPSHASLTSRRVGNFQYNPEWRILFDQLWVR